MLRLPFPVIRVICCRSFASSVNTRLVLEHLPPTPPDLKLPFKDIKPPVKINIDAPSHATKITTLENGVRVTSSNWDSAPGSVGIAINTGSRYEKEEEKGAATYCEKMSFKSSKRFSFRDIMTEIETRGVNITSQHNREQLLFEIEGLREDLPHVLDILSDSVTNPLFDTNEFEEQKFVLHHTVSQKLNDPEQWPFEISYTAAYGKDSPMGNSSPTDLNILAGVKMETVQNFMRTHYTPSRIVVGGLGLDHDKLVEQTNRLFGHLPKDNVAVNTEDRSASYYAPSMPNSQYKGGLINIVDDRESKIGIELPGNFQRFSAAFVGFDAPCLLSGKEYYVANILATLLGSGSSFSSGGPGKGMYTRVYREILSQGYVQAGHNIYNAHQDGGVFGLLLTGFPQYTGQMIGLAASGLVRLQQITDEEFERAKSQLISMVCNNLESTLPSLDDILRQVSIYNSRDDFHYHVDQIQKSTKEEALQLVNTMLQTKPTVIVYGNDEKSPIGYEAIEQYFKSNIQQ